MVGVFCLLGRRDHIGLAPVLALIVGSPPAEAVHFGLGDFQPVLKWCFFCSRELFSESPSTKLEVVFQRDSCRPFVYFQLSPAVVDTVGKDLLVQAFCFRVLSSNCQAEGIS